MDLDYTNGLLLERNEVLRDQNELLERQVKAMETANRIELMKLGAHNGRLSDVAGLAKMRKAAGL